jgi:hypothetical protein
MSARLSESTRGRERVWELHNTFSIGRGSENDLVLSADTSVSRKHARIRRAGGQWLLEDLDSQNGTLVQRSGSTIRVQRDFELLDGDVICTGAARISFLVEEDAADGETGHTTIGLVQGSTIIGRALPRFLRGTESADEKGVRAPMDASEIRRVSLGTEEAAERARAVMRKHGLRITSDNGREIVADGGSQLTTRLAGGLLGSARSFPRRVTIRLRTDGAETVVEASIRDTLEAKELDPNIRKRYEEDFARWSEALRGAFR